MEERLSAARLQTGNLERIGGGREDYERQRACDEVRLFWLFWLFYFFFPRLQMRHEPPLLRHALTLL